jgi:hypothetical protein
MVTRRPSPARQRGAALPASSGSEAPPPPCRHVLTLLTLLIAAEDRAHDLLYVQQAFSALGKLVAAGYDSPRAQLDADRGEMSALLAILNDHAAGRIAGAIAAVEAAGRAARQPAQ